MGWEVIAFCNIDSLDKPFTQKQLEKIKEMVVSFNGFNIELNGDYIGFTLSGNKGVDYKILDKIKEFLLKGDMKFSIRTGEYSETGNGYWFDTDKN